MATVGTIVVDFIADTSQFQKGVKRSQGDVASFKKRASQSFTAIASKAAVVGGALFAAGGAVAGMAKLAENAARIDTMRQSFDNLSAAAGYTGDTFQMLNDAVNGTMSRFELLEQANNALLLGVTDSSEQMAEMFDIAQRLGRAVGKDAAFGVESLITGIGRQSRLMLDNIGIIVKSEQAYQEYADRIGVAVSELTKQQKQTAFTEAAMESARQKVQDLGEEQLTFQDTLDQFIASVKDLAIGLGQVLIPPLTTVTTLITKGVDAVNAIIGGVKEFIQVQQTMGAETDTLSERVQQTVLDFENLLRSLGDVKNPLQVLTEMIDAAPLDALQQMKTILENVLQAGQLNIATFDLLRQAYQSTVAEIARLNMHLNNMAQNTVTTQQEIEALAQSMQTLVDLGLRPMNTEYLLLNAQQQQITASYRTAQFTLQDLSQSQQTIIGLTQQYGDALARAAIEGKNFGRAVKSALLSIAATMAANAAIFALLNMFTGGAFGGAVSFGKFLFGGLNVISAQSGANFVSKQPGILAYHPNEHVQVTPRGQSTGSTHVTIVMNDQAIYDAAVRGEDHTIFLEG